MQNIKLWLIFNVYNFMFDDFLCMLGLSEIYGKN